MLQKGALGDYHKELDQDEGQERPPKGNNVKAEIDAWGDSNLLRTSYARHCSRNWWYIIEQIKYPQYHGAYILLSHVNLFGL